MSEPQIRPNVPRDLYALVVYLHAQCNRDLLDQIAAEQLSYGQLQLLERLRATRHQPTIRQAAAMMHVSLQHASRLVDDLAKRGLILREPDERDGRIKRVAITPAGRDVVTRLHACRYEHIAGFAGELTPEERQHLERALEKILEREDVAACRPAAA